MIRALATGALLSIAACAAAAPAAACNARRIALPAHHVARSAPWLIGDSTAILAAPVLARLGVAADARGCRQFDQGVALAVRRGRRAPGAIVLALGANGQVRRGQIARARRVLGRQRFLILVTPRNSPPTRTAMLAAARAHPDQILTLDWAALSRRHPGWFAGGDGLHVGYAGARAYARFVRAGVAPFVGPRRPAAFGLPSEAPAGTACGRVRAYGRATRVFVIRGADVIGCEHARALMRAPRLHPPGPWRFRDWRAVGRGPWTDVLVRTRDSAMIAGITA